MRSTLCTFLIFIVFTHAIFRDDDAFEAGYKTNEGERTYNRTYIDEKRRLIAIGATTSALLAACAATLVAALPCAGLVATVAGGVALALIASGDSSPDDAWVTITASTIYGAGGNSLEITWYSKDDTDRDSLGSLSPGETDTWREDLGDSPLRYIELRVDETDDICVTNFVFIVGEEVSGTKNKEAVDLPIYVISYVTGVSIKNGQDCLWFGYGSYAIGKFYFKWEEALSCHDKHFGGADRGYATCFKTAMKRSDVMTNGNFESKYYSQSLSYSFNNATCINTLGTDYPLNCECDEGYKDFEPSTINAPQMMCLDIDECANNNDNNCAVDNNAVCINTVGSYLCECLPGYNGDPTDKCTSVSEANSVLNKLDFSVDSNIAKTKNDNPMFGYMSATGLVLFILINNIFIGLWCLCKRNINKNNGYYKGDIIIVN
eukprot:25547_1